MPKRNRRRAPAAFLPLLAGSAPVRACALVGVIGACLSAASAPAQTVPPGSCPEMPADIAAGILVQYEGYSSQVRSHGEGLFLDFSGEGGTGDMLVTDRGVLVVDNYRVEDGRAVTGDRERLDLDQSLGPIEAGARYALGGHDVRADGSRVPVALQISVGQPRPLTLGGCDFADVLQVTVIGRLPDESFVEVVEYVPALGYAVFTGYGEDLTDVVFDLPVGIEVASVTGLVPPPVAGAAPQAPPVPRPEVILPSPEK